jgi:hypothetical protein
VRRRAPLPAAVGQARWLTHKCCSHVRPSAAVPISGYMTPRIGPMQAGSIAAEPGSPRAWSRKSLPREGGGCRLFGQDHAQNQRESRACRPRSLSSPIPAQPRLPQSVAPCREAEPNRNQLACSCTAPHLAARRSVASPFHGAGGSMAAFLSSQAFAGSATNFMNALASSGCCETVNRPTPTRPYSISSAGRGPRYSVPA